jgi:hypothetical protein
MIQFEKRYGDSARHIRRELVPHKPKTTNPATQTVPKNLSGSGMIPALKQGSAILTVALVFGSLAAAAQECSRVIDDFTTGKTQMDLRVNGTAADTNTQTGSMIGGSRRIDFSTAANPFLQLGEVKVGNGALTVSNGVREFFRTLVFWGDASNHIVPPGYLPSGCDRFRVIFDSNSGELNFNVQVATAAGPKFPLFQVGTNLPPEPSPTGLPFCVDFPFANFVTNTKDGNGQAVKPNFDAQGIIHIDMVIQSGSQFGANNFAITKIAMVDSGTAAAAPCAFVANN